MLQNAVQTDQVREYARYIVDNGKLIHERVSKIITEHLSQSRKSNLSELSAPQLHVIKTIRHHGELSITQLSEILEVSPPSASAMVSRLQERGILCRERGKSDRRKVVVRVSSDVDADIEVLDQKLLESFMELVEKIGPETARKWCDVLARVKDVL